MASAACFGSEPVSSAPDACHCPDNLFEANKSGYSLADRDVAVVVCLRHFATQLAGPGGSADAVYKELTSNLIPGSHLVAAGVVAVNRAQEHGYTLLGTL